jgi:hypothetical protein
MRYEIIVSIIFLVLLASCSGPNQHLQKLSKEVYSRKTWEPPLPPNEFKSDGCSLWPDSEWVDCCVEHDVNYWMVVPERRESNQTLLLKNVYAGKATRS